MAKESKKSYGAAIDKYMKPEEEQRDAIHKFIGSFGDDYEEAEEE